MTFIVALYAPTLKQVFPRKQSYQPISDLLNIRDKCLSDESKADSFLVQISLYDINPND